MHRFALFTLVVLSPVYVQANQELHGAWHSEEIFSDAEEIFSDASASGHITYVLNFFDDGQFDMTARMEFTPPIAYRDFWSDTVEDMGEGVRVELSDKGPIETYEFFLAGTWHTQGDSLFLDVLELKITLNDEQDVFEAISDVYVEIIILTYEKAGEAIPEEELITEEEKADLTASFKEIVHLSIDEDMDGLYFIDGDVLILVAGRIFSEDFLEDRDLHLTRQLVPTTVQPISWGRAKDIATRQR